MPYWEHRETTTKNKAHIKCAAFYYYYYLLLFCLQNTFNMHEENEEEGEVALCDHAQGYMSGLSLSLLRLSFSSPVCYFFDIFFFLFFFLHPHVLTSFFVTNWQQDNPDLPARTAHAQTPLSLHDPPPLFFPSIVLVAQDSCLRWSSDQSRVRPTACLTNVK